MGTCLLIMQLRVKQLCFRKPVQLQIHFHDFIRKSIIVVVMIFCETCKKCISECPITECAVAAVVQKMASYDNLKLFFFLPHATRHHHRHIFFTLLTHLFSDKLFIQSQICS